MLLLALSCFGPLPGRLDGDSPADSASASEAARNENFRTAAGDWARDFLSDDTYTSLLVEIDWIEGHPPSDEAVAALEAALEKTCTKPGGVEIRLDDELPDQGAPAWSVSAAQDLEIAWRDHYRGDGRAVLYFLYLDGHSEQDAEEGRILGYAYRASSMVMFEETIASTGSGLPLTSDVEDTVIVHELGHVLGLVNNGIDMVEPHQDEAHGAHDTSSDCIMYWAAETDGITDLLLGEPLDFDEACIADMKAAGGMPGL